MLLRTGASAVSGGVGVGAGGLTKRAQSSDQAGTGAQVVRRDHEWVCKKAARPEASHVLVSSLIGARGLMGGVSDHRGPSLGSHHRASHAVSEDRDRSGDHDRREVHDLSEAHDRTEDSSRTEDSNKSEGSSRTAARDPSEVHDRSEARDLSADPDLLPKGLRERDGPTEGHGHRGPVVDLSVSRGCPVASQRHVLLLRVRVGATSVAGDPAVAVEIAEMRVRDPRADRGLDLQAHRR